MLKFKFLPKFSIVIILLFILFTIIGTLSHEFGHIVVAKYFGYETTLSYGHMNYEHKGYSNDKIKIENLLEGYKYEDYDNWPEELMTEVESLSEALRKKYSINKTHSFWVTVGGPAQTFLTSFIGLIILYLRREKWRINLKTIDWLAVFMSLFALREVFNFVDALISLIFYSKSNFYSDEFIISIFLEFNEWAIPIVTMIIGLFISCYVIFKIIPKIYRFSFIISGLIGGLAGFALWFGFLGKILFSL